MQRETGSTLPDASSASRPSTPDDLVNARQASQ